MLDEHRRVAVPFVLYFVDATQSVGLLCND